MTSINTFLIILFYFYYSNSISYSTSFLLDPAPTISKYINCIFQDSQGQYWFGSNDNGVYVYNPHQNTMIHYTTKDGLGNNQVNTIQEDKQNHIWVLTAGGIHRYEKEVNNIEGKTFTSYPHPKQKQKNIPTAVSTGDLWFEMAGGAYNYDGQAFTYLLLPAPPLDAKHINTTNPTSPDATKVNAYSVYCSLKDSKGNIWLGTQTMGACKYDGKSFTWFTEKGLAGPAIRALFEDSKGNIWFGNNGNGLFYYRVNTQDQSIQNFTEEYGLGNPEFLKTGKSGPGTIARVWAVQEDNYNNIWIGTTDAGIWKYNPKEQNKSKALTNFTTRHGLTSNAINTIYKDKKGDLWFGTDGGGICKYNGFLFSAFIPNL